MEGPHSWWSCWWPFGPGEYTWNFRRAFGGVGTFCGEDSSACGWPMTQTARKCRRMASIWSNYCTTCINPVKARKTSRNNKIFGDSVPSAYANREWLLRTALLFGSNSLLMKSVTSQSQIVCVMEVPGLRMHSGSKRASEYNLSRREPVVLCSSSRLFVRGPASSSYRNGAAYRPFWLLVPPSPFDWM